MWPNRTADGNSKTSTPGLISEFKENEYEESGSNAKNQLNIIDSSIMSNNNNNNSHSANLINNNASEEFPILDELDRLAKVIIFNKIIKYILFKKNNKYKNRCQNIIQTDK